MYYTCETFCLCFSHFDSQFVFVSCIHYVTLCVSVKDLPKSSLTARDPAAAGPMQAAVQEPQKRLVKLTAEECVELREY